MNSLAQAVPSDKYRNRMNTSSNQSEELYPAGRQWLQSDGCCHFHGGRKTETAGVIIITLVWQFLPFDNILHLLDLQI